MAQHYLAVGPPPAFVARAPPNSVPPFQQGPPLRQTGCLTSLNSPFSTSPFIPVPGPPQQYGFCAVPYPLSSVNLEPNHVSSTTYSGAVQNHQQQQQLQQFGHGSLMYASLNSEEASGSQSLALGRNQYTPPWSAAGLESSPFSIGSYQHTRTSFQQQFAVQPFRPRTSGGGLYKTTDGFSQCALPPPLRQAEIDPEQGSAAFRNASQLSQFSQYRYASQDNPGTTHQNWQPQDQEIPDRTSTFGRPLLRQSTGKPAGPHGETIGFRQPEAGRLQNGDQSQQLYSSAQYFRQQGFQQQQQQQQHQEPKPPQYMHHNCQRQSHSPHLQQSFRECPTLEESSVLKSPYPKHAETETVGHLQLPAVRHRPGGKKTPLGARTGSVTSFKEKQTAGPGRSANNGRRNDPIAKKTPTKDEVKEMLETEMLQATWERFPELGRLAYFVPPVRTFRTKHERHSALSTKLHDVRSPTLVQPATLLGDQTEDTVIRFLAEIFDNFGEPLLVLPNYEFDNYLIHLSKKTLPCGLGTPIGSSDESSPGNTSLPGAQPVPEMARKLFPCMMDRGDFDVLIISPRFGFVVIETKTMKGKESGTTALESPSQAGVGPVVSDDEEDGVSTSRDGERVACGAEGRTACQWATRCEFTSGLAAADSEIRSQLQGLGLSEGSEACSGFGPKQAAATDSGDTSDKGRDSDWRDIQGARSQEPAGSSRQDHDKDFRKTLRKSLKQLIKGKEALTVMTSDLLPSGPPLVMVPALPHTSAEDLRRLLLEPELAQLCMEVLKVDCVDEVLRRCITSDLVARVVRPASDTANLAAPGSPEAREATECSLEPALSWWWALFCGTAASGLTKEESNVDEENLDSECGGKIPWKVYEKIVSRFCGPYSRLPARTVSDCVHLTGVEFGRSILREDQLRALKSPAPFLLLTGPPGCGKTLLLGLRAAEWAKSGEEVVVVCTEGVNSGSLVSWTLHDRVLEAVRQHRTSALRRQARDRPASALAPLPAQQDVTSLGQDVTEDVEEAMDVDDQQQMSECSANGDSRKRHVEEVTGLAANPSSPSDPSDPHPKKCCQDSLTHTATDKVTRAMSAPISGPDSVEVTRKKGKSHQANLQKTFCGGGHHGLVNHQSQGPCPSKDPDHAGAAALGWVGQALEARERGQGQGQTVAGRQHHSSCSSESQDSGPELPCPTSTTTDKRRGSRKGWRRSAGQGQVLPEEVEVSNVHKAVFRADTDMGQFVEDLLARHGGRGPLHVIVDECQRPCSMEYVFGLFSSARQSLLRMGQLYQDLASSAGLGDNDPRPSGHRGQGGAPRVRPEDYFQTMSSRLEKLDERLGLLQVNGTRTGGPPILHSAEWRRELEALRWQYDQVRTFKDKAQRCLLSGCAGTVAQGVIDVLEELSSLTVSVMGYLWLVYSTLTFFQLHHLFSLLHQHQQAQLGVEAGGCQADPDRPRVCRQREAEELPDLQQRPGPAGPTPASQGPGSGPGHRVTVWAATTDQTYAPPGYERQSLTVCIRCPPTVQRVLQWTQADVRGYCGLWKLEAPSYTYVTRGCDVNPPLPSDGPPVTWLDHASHMTSHSEVNDCAECGRALADHLLTTLGLRLTTDRRGSKKGKNAQEGQLYFHDVIISGSPIHQPDCAFIQELKHRGIPLLYESQKLTTPPPYKDNIFVVGGNYALGLEAFIVVYVPELKRITAEEKAALRSSRQASAKGEGRGWKEGEKVGEEEEEEVVYRSREEAERERLLGLGWWNRQYLWNIASRSLSHLIIFHV